MQRLTKTIAALLMLSIALQIASCWAALEIGARFEDSRRQTAVAAGLRDLAERYGSMTYLALVALASSDWDMLLAQQATAKELGVQFQRAAQGLLDGGPAHEGGREVDLVGIVDPEIHASLVSVLALWDEVRAAHIRVLRSPNRSITSNPDLEKFRLAVRNLAETLAQISEQIRNHSVMETRWLDRERCRWASSGSVAGGLHVIGGMLERVGSRRRTPLRTARL